MIKPSVWLAGDWKRAEFTSARDWLGRRGRCRVSASLEAALNTRDGQGPAAIVVAQARPGQYAPNMLEALGAAWPATRVILLKGPYCEGEHRKTTPLAGIANVSWRRWMVGLEEALDDGAAEQAPERCPLQGKKAAIWTHRQATFDGLADALASLQMQAVWLGGSGCGEAAADIWLYDGWEHVLPIPQMRATSRGAKRTAKQPPARLLIMDFPRPDDGLAAAALGIDAMLPRPVLLADLRQTLQRVLGRQT